MAKGNSKEEKRRKKEEQATQTQKLYSSTPGWMPFAKHLGAYVFLLIAAMLYFKPVAFNGKTLQQHDNLQAYQMQTEITNYRAVEGGTINWTNQYFGGMPTAIMQPKNPNFVHKTAPLLHLFQPYNEWVTLFLIMFFAYVGLSLLGCNIFISVGLSLILSFFTFNTLLIAAGHTGKMITLASIPFLLGSFLYAYRKNLFLGASLFSFGLSFNISRNHIQMTYYLFFALGIIGLFFLIDAIRNNALPKFGKFVGAMIIASVLAVFSNLGLLWSTYDYGEESTRGKSELTKKSTKGSGFQKSTKDASSGLGYDYVFSLSMEKMETASLMFPNFYGGTQGKSFYSNQGSHTQAAFSSPAVQRELVAAAQSAGVKGNEQINQFMTSIIGQYTRQYRGSQSMCGGPMYYGVVACFLLILSLLLLTGVTKWAFVGALLFLTFLAWGKFFAVFNDLMYYYFPLYSKFRDVKMTLLVAQPIVIITIGLGLMELINFEKEKYTNTLSAKLLPKLRQSISRDGYVVLAGVISLGLCLFVYFYSMFFGLSAPSDIELFKISPTLVGALEKDRAELAQGDIFKAMGYVIAAMAVLYLYARKTLTVEIMAVLITVLACMDLVMVNREYVNEESYKETKLKEEVKRLAENPSKADKGILKDKSIYRVVDYSRGYPSQNANACSYHKSMGGYSAAKPALYQEFWNYYQLDNGNLALQQHSNLMNMLNVKYIIVSPDRFMDNPTALGNAWLVENVKVVPNADEEIAALDDLEPLKEAVVQEKYAGYVNGLNSSYNTGDKIYLSKYHPDTMTYQSETTKERFAVFSEMYYPPSKGWTVYIDGKEIEPFVKTNYVLRGLKIPAGKHEIKMVFEPISISVGGTVGVICSLLIIVGLLVAVYFEYKKNNRS